MKKIRWIDDLLFCSALRSTARRAAFLLRAATSKALVAFKAAVWGSGRRPPAVRPPRLPSQSVADRRGASPTAALLRSATLRDGSAAVRDGSAAPLATVGDALVPARGDRTGLAKHHHRRALHVPRGTCRARLVGSACGHDKAPCRRARPRRARVAARRKPVTRPSRSVAVRAIRPRI